MLRLIYIDMVKCACIRIRTFEGIKTREKCSLLVIPRYVQCLFNKNSYPYTAQVRPRANSEAKPYDGQFMLSSHGNKRFRIRSMKKQRGMAIGFWKTATAV